MYEFATFVLSETTVNQIKALPENLRLKFYDAVVNYGLHGIEPELSGLEYVIWIGIRDLILYSKRKSENWKQKQQSNGKKGGRPKTQENPENPTKPNENTETQNNPENPNNPSLFIETQENPENPTKPKITQKTHNGNGNGNENDKNKGNTGFFLPDLKPKNTEPAEDIVPDPLPDKPDKPSGTKEDATAMFNKARALWNDREIPPQCRDLIIPPAEYDCLRTFQNYSWLEVDNAIKNYHWHLTKSGDGWKQPPPYGSIYGFLKTGVARYYEDKAFEKQFREQEMNHGVRK